MVKFLRKSVFWFSLFWISLSWMAVSGATFEIEYYTVPETGKTVEVAKGHINLMLWEPRPVEEVKTLLMPYGIKVRGDVANMGGYFLQLPDFMPLDEGIRLLKSLPEVRYAGPDYVIYPLATTPNDPRFPQQGLLNTIKAPDAWDITTGIPDAWVAVLDTGVRLDHEDLRDKIVFCRQGDIVDFVDNDTDPSDESGHGTGVAGIAAATTNNALGVAGVAWLPKILPLRVLSGGGGLTSWAVSAINYVTQNCPNVRVINMSFGGYGPDSMQEQALNNAYNRGIVPVGGAGNDGTETPFFPAAFDRVVAVCATHLNDQKWDYSNYGTWVDICAPSNEGMVTTSIGGGYGGFGGTSGATPVVSGVVALIASLHPNWTAEQIVLKLLQSADNIDAQNPAYAGKLGSGRVNANQALRGSGPDIAPPIISITNPPDNSSVRGGQIPFTAVATDDSGSVPKVEFFVDGQKIGEDTTGDQNNHVFTTVWDTSTASETTHILLVRAFDPVNNTSTDQHSVKVDRSPPQVLFTYPPANSIVSKTINVQISVIDNSPLKFVNLFIDGLLRQSFFSPPYVYVWDTTSVPEGTHTLMASAQDILDNPPTSATLTIQVDNTPPSLNIDSPQAGALLSGVVPIQVSATDSIGLNTVEILVDGQVVSAFGGTPPFTYNWDTMPVVGKNHRIGARAVDLAGNVASQEISVQVKNDFISPQVRFALPPAGIRACGTIHFLVDATDNREVLSVDIMEGNTLLTRLTSSPYAFDYAWLTSQEGAHSLTATASDASENTSQASLSVEVLYPQHSPPSSYPASGPLNLSFIAPETAVTDGFLIYREKGSQGFFTALNPSARLGNTFLFQIPSSALPPAGLEYIFSINSLYFTCETQRYEVASLYPFGDLNLDGKVDELDALEIGFYFGTPASSPRFKPHMDLNRDNIIDINDLNILAGLITL